MLTSAATSNNKPVFKNRESITMNSTYNFSVVRILRRNQGLTLNELAARSGITYATLENVETNKAAPSLKTLDSIAGGLGITTGKLITMSENQIVQRRKAEFVTDEYNEKTNPGAENCRIANFNNVKMFRVQAQKGDKVNVPQFHGNCNEMCYVYSGCIDLTVSGETYRLNPDDCILFDGVLDHTYEQIETGEYATVHIPKDVYSLKNLLVQADEQEVDQVT